MKSAPAAAPLWRAGLVGAATRGGGEVIELECGITVYPARSEGGRWRAVWQRPASGGVRGGHRTYRRAVPAI